MKLRKRETITSYKNMDENIKKRPRVQREESYEGMRREAFIKVMRV